MSTVSFSRYRAISRARPTAASAAATVTTMKAKTPPAASPRYEPADTNATFTPFSISSTLIRMMSTFLRATTPTTPMQNRIAERSRYADDSIIPSPALSYLLLRQGDRPDHGGEEQHRGDLEREQVVGEQRPPHGLHRSHLGRRTLRHRETARQDRGFEEEEPRGDHAQNAHRRRALDRQAVLRHVDQHDDEDEQHHHRPGVDDHLDRREEVRLAQHEEGRDREQGQDQVEGRRHRVLPRHHHDRAADRDRPEQDEEGRFHRSPTSPAACRS